MQSGEIAEATDEFRTAVPHGAVADIEEIVSWALGRIGRLPWRNPRDEELSLDQGMTVRQRRKPRGHWYLVYAGAGHAALLDGLPAARAPMMIPGNDAASVIEAIKALAPATAAAVLQHARAKTRPEWIGDDLPPRPIYAEDCRVRVVTRQRSKRKQYRVAPYCPLYWPVEPKAICASQEAYTLWHRGLSTLRDWLDGELKRWPSIGFRASPEPWNGRPRRGA